MNKTLVLNSCSPEKIDDIVLLAVASPSKVARK